MDSLQNDNGKTKKEYLEELSMKIVNEKLLLEDEMMQLQDELISVYRKLHDIESFKHTDLANEYDAYFQMLCLFKDQVSQYLYRIRANQKGDLYGTEW